MTGFVNTTFVFFALLLLARNTPILSGNCAQSRGPSLGIYTPFSTDGCSRWCAMQSALTFLFVSLFYTHVHDRMTAAVKKRRVADFGTVSLLVVTGLIYDVIENDKKHDSFMVVTI